MFVEFHYWNIERIIKDFITDSRIKEDFDVRWAIGKSRISRGIMSYRESEKVILFNPDRMNEYYREFPSFTPKEFIVLAFAHELGHHLHWNSAERESLLEIKNKERAAGKRLKEVRYVFEKGAWDYGKQLVPEDLKDKFDLMNEINLEKYANPDGNCEKLLDMQLEYYRGLSVAKEMKLTKGNLSKVIKWKKSWAVGKKKTEVVEELLEVLSGDCERLVKRFYNDLIIHAVRNGREKRVILQSMSTYDDLTVYRFIE